MAAGQLTASLANVEGPQSGGHPVSLLLFNTNTAQETVTVSVSQVGGSVRTLVQIVLDASGSAIVSNVPLGPTDYLQAMATDATQVNYLTVQGAVGAIPAITVYDANGQPKSNISGQNILAATTKTLFGGALSTATLAAFLEAGNIFRQSGNPIASNAADTTDDVLTGIQLPANVFDTAGRGLCITAQGKFGATGNNKRVRLWANPTLAGHTITNGIISGGTVSGVGSGALLLDSGTQTGNAVGWSEMVNLFKFGAAGSNTQYAQGTPIFGTTHGGISVPTFPTLVEGAVINLVLTGASQTTGAAADVVANFFEVNAMN